MRHRALDLQRRHRDLDQRRGLAPLPRREYTRRSDYNALRIVNRHTITPYGWSHEQLNTKVLRKPDGSQVEIARELGFDDYRHDSQVSFCSGLCGLEGDQQLLGGGARALGELLDQPPGLHLKTKLDGMGLVMSLFEQADTLVEGGKVKAADTDGVFAKYVEPALAGCDPRWPPTAAAVHPYNRGQGTPAPGAGSRSAMEPE